MVPHDKTFFGLLFVRDLKFQVSRQRVYFYTPILERSRIFRSLYTSCYIQADPDRYCHIEQFGVYISARTSGLKSYNNMDKWIWLANIYLTFNIFH